LIDRPTITDNPFIRTSGNIGDLNPENSYMPNIFRTILERGIRNGIMPNRTAQAREWYRHQAAQAITTPNQLLGTVPLDQLRGAPRVGDMYMYWYDPKWKKKLPVYDRFPLIYLYQMTKDGFMGLNLHFLHHSARAMMMDALYEYRTDDTYDEKTKIIASYQIMKRSYKLSMYRHCIKRYLTSHVRSRFLYIPPKDWDTALFLPVEKLTNNTHLANQYLTGRQYNRGGS